MTWTDRPANMEAPGHDLTGDEIERVLDEVSRLNVQEQISAELIDALRITTAGSFHTSSTDPIEVTKLRSAALTVVGGYVYKFSGQVLYQAGDPWAMEIHKNSTGGTIVGGFRFDVSSNGAAQTWEVYWPCGSTEENIQFFYVANRLSGAGSLTLFGIQDGFNNSFAAISRVSPSAVLRDVP